MQPTPLDRAATAVEAAISAGNVPGAALGIVDRAGNRWVRWAGNAQTTPEARTVTRETWFDLASLTKVLVTTIEVLRLVEDGLADLTDPIARLLPDLRQVDGDPGLRDITLAALLTHTAGLPAWAPIYTWGGTPADLAARVRQEKWQLGAPCYSDIGFMWLGQAVERVRGTPLAEMIRSSGLGAHPPCTDICAATEDCTWRGAVLCGTVHDENAAALGGFAGHAGLFGTIDGVLDAGHDLLTDQLLSPAAMAEMARPRTATRALGWQIRHDVGPGAEPPWTGGSLCAPGTLGHTGFTGTGLWIDRSSGYAWALLTNRVHPSRHRETGIQDLRRTVGNLIATDMLGRAQTR